MDKTKKIAWPPITLSALNKVIVCTVLQDTTAWEELIKTPAQQVTTVMKSHRHQLQTQQTILLTKVWEICVQHQLTAQLEWVSPCLAQMVISNS